MKIIVLCAALAAFCTCAAAQVATPLSFNNAPVHVRGHLVHGGETWFIGPLVNSRRAVLRTESGRVVQASVPHAHADSMRTRVLFGSAGVVFYLIANTATQLDELWCTTGDPARNVRVAVHDAYSISEFAELNGRVYYTVYDQLEHRATIRRVSAQLNDAADFQVLDGGVRMVAASGRLHVQSGDSAGAWLGATDGTGPATPYWLGAFSGPGPEPDPAAVSVLTVFNQRLWFWFIDSGLNWRVFQTDGTAAGTALMAGPIPVWMSYNYLEVRSFVAGGLLYFFEPGGTGLLWRSDGTRTGTFPLGNAPDFPHDTWFEHDGALWFTRRHFEGPLLLRCDGTPAGTTLWRQFPGPDDHLLPLLSRGRRLYLRSNRSGYQSSQLWYVDTGSAADPSLNRAYPFEIAYTNDDFLRFSGFVGETGGAPLFADSGGRMYELNLDAQPSTPGGQGCTTQPGAGWTALALAWMALPWVRRRFSLRYARRQGTIPPPASVGRASKVHP